MTDLEFITNRVHKSLLSFYFSKMVTDHAIIIFALNAHVALNRSNLINTK